MGNKMWSFWCLFVMEFYLGMFCLCHCLMVSRMEAVVEMKEETAIPVTTLSPPEGNTTFLNGTSWCVALPGVSQVDLQVALDWACGQGMVDCSPIRSGGDCFNPNTLVSHASYAFNAYYQQNGNSDIACNFGGTATLTKKNPRYGKCLYASSGSESSSAPSLSKHRPCLWYKFAGALVMFLYLDKGISVLGLHTKPSMVMQ